MTKPGGSVAKGSRSFQSCWGSCTTPTAAEVKQISRDIPEDVAGSWQLSIFSAQLPPSLPVHPCQAGRAKALLGLSHGVWAAGPGAGMAHVGHGGRGQPHLALPGWEPSFSCCHLGAPFSQMSSAGQDSELNTPAWQGKLPRLPEQYVIKSHAETKQLLPPQINHKKEENVSHF